MSYQVLARKWRPQTFDDVVGQAHVTTPLRNAIRADRVPHAILLTGPRGVGKTTLARILARCLNCEKGPTDTPCGECPSCAEIAAGNSTDVQEVDAASRTSVDDVRELIAAVRYAAAPGKHRIFVVDEVHMLSTAAFNALLKTLEEPPPRSLFVFATTNPEKIPFTVVSRCQRYDLRRIAAAEIVGRLHEIARSESVEISDKSLLSIAREADGSMRDSQTLLDQIIAFGGTEIDDEQVAEVLDLVDRRLLLAIAEACVDGDPAAALEAAGRAAESGVDAGRLGQNLLQLLRDLVVARIAPDAPQLIEAADEELAELREIAERAEPARLRRMFRALVREQEDLAWAPQPFAVLEMALVRLATLPSGDDVSALLSRLEALEHQLGSGAPAPRRPDPGGGTRGTPGATGTASGGSGGSAPGGGRGTRGRPSASPPSGPGSASKAPSAGPTSAGARPADGDDPVEPVPTSTAPTADATLAASATPQAEPAARPARTDGATEGAGPPGPRLVETAEDANLVPEATPASPPTELGAAPLPVVFDRLRRVAGEGNPGLFAALEGGSLIERGADHLTIAIPESFRAQRVRDRHAALAAACTRVFGREMRISVEAVEGGPGARRGPGSGGRRPLDTEGVRQLRQKALNHPGINTALELFGADVVEIRPLQDEASSSPAPGARG